MCQGRGPRGDPVFVCGGGAGDGRRGERGRCVFPGYKELAGCPAICGAGAALVLPAVVLTQTLVESVAGLIYVRAIPKLGVATG